MRPLIICQKGDRGNRTPIAFERLEALSRGGIPDFDGIVACTRCEPLAIRRKGDRVNRAIMAFERLKACIPVRFYYWLCTDPARFFRLKSLLYQTANRCKYEG